MLHGKRSERRQHPQIQGMTVQERSIVPVVREGRPPIPVPRTLDEMLTLAEVVVK